MPRPHIVLTFAERTERWRINDRETDGTNSNLVREQALDASAAGRVRASPPDTGPAVDASALSAVLRPGLARPRQGSRGDEFGPRRMDWSGRTDAETMRGATLPRKLSGLRGTWSLEE